MTDTTLGDGLNFTIKRIDNGKPKCLSISGTSVVIRDCNPKDVTQTWYLASDGVLHTNDTTKCINVNLSNNTVKIDVCNDKSTKFSYSDNKLTVIGSNPARCLNLRGRGLKEKKESRCAKKNWLGRCVRYEDVVVSKENYVNESIVDVFPCAQAAQDTITWISKPVMKQTVQAKKEIVSEKEQQVINASVCRSTPNGLNTLFDSIDKCTSNEELIRNQNFGQMIINLQQDISDLKANITDSLAKGDLLFGTQPHNELIQQVLTRNKELKDKKQKLSDDILKKESIVNRSNRDFTDVKESIPEPQPKKILHFFEEYTLAVLLLSYFFMILSAIYFYTLISPFKLKALLEGITLSSIVTAFLFMVLLHIS